MFKVNDYFTIEVKNYSRNIRNLLSIIAGISILIGGFYCLYWGLALNDDILIQYSGEYTKGLVGLFFEDNTSIENYLYTGYYMLFMSVPCYILIYLVEKAERTLLNIHKYTVKKENQKLKNEQIENELMEFTTIKNYSICLSIDYPSLNTLKQVELNKYFYNRISENIKKLFPTCKIKIGKAMIFTSGNFYNYDILYSNLLKELSKVEKVLSKKKIEIIPTITTDAYRTEINPQQAIENHYEIIKCNLQNRATSTKLFSQKYNFLKQTKYAGIPIGLYSSFDGKVEHEYDLNIINKNLNYAVKELSKK